MIAAPLRDLDLIAQTMRHPRVWPHISDDFCPPPDEFRPAQADSLIYLGIHDGPQFCGLFVLHPHNFACWEVHTCLLPHTWGERAIDATKAGADWMWANTACRRIITNVPASNRLALRLAECSGMKQFGVNEKSLLKNGTLHDQIMLGMSKE